MGKATKENVHCKGFYRNRSVAAAEACKIASENDQEIIEEEVAFLQDEFDHYSDDLIRCKSLLEGGIV